MAKGKNGGGEYKKVKGSSGKSSPKGSTVSQPSQQVVMPSMPIAPDLFQPQKSIQRIPDMPLQPRQSFDIQERQKPETMSFKNTAIERLID
tara:strand:+ start:1514 stop:1786 length:273 start_codon:yes stop_codon:yes gene_type:complete